jgi:nucleoside 2-deoxyribosyltransferase
MPFDAKVFRVLVASPGDVGDERNVIPEVINEWNAVSALQAKSILMPVKWESHSAPMLGNRPQAIINEQLVNECDLLVGVFWTRIGTHTGVSVSGTAEEIEQFVAQNKPVMLYFSQSPIDPEKIEIDQFTVLRSFKEKMRLKGLTETYSGLPDFRQKFSRQLSINLNSILSQAATEIAEKQKTAPKSKTTQAIIPAPIQVPVADTSAGLTKAQIHEYLIKAVTTVAGMDGWANIAAVGKYLVTYTPVDYHLLGFEKLNKFLESTKLFEIKTEQKSSKAKAVDSAYARLIKKV